jgi:adenosylcobinamide-phosphate synthase
LSALITLLAYLVDYLFGEFLQRMHPIVLLSKVISFFEKHWYRDLMFRGVMLVLFSLTIAFFALYLLRLFLPDTLLTIILGGILLSHNMLYSEVRKLLTASNPKEALTTLVSYDTQNLNVSEVIKGGIETYAKNLSNGVIAPLFYLLLFGLEGIVVYKVINKLDAMVGYRTDRYERFGKASARLDDLLNFIPARFTALLILLVTKHLNSFSSVFNDAKHHTSVNAGYPISAMAYAFDLKLGGSASYHGKIVDKPYVGNGKEILETSDLRKVLTINSSINLLIIGGLGVLVVILFLF